MSNREEINKLFNDICERYVISNREKTLLLYTVDRNLEIDSDKIYLEFIDSEDIFPELSFKNYKDTYSYLSDLEANLKDEYVEKLRTLTVPKIKEVLNDKTKNLIYLYCKKKINESNSII